MEQRKYKTKAEVLARGQEAVGKTLGEIDKTGRIATGKGAIGTVVEESWFGYKPNSNPAPDFEATTIVRRNDRFAADETDGEIVYDGEGECYTDSELEKATYYYAAFSILKKGRTLMQQNQIAQLDEVAKEAQNYIDKAEALSPNNAEIYILKKMNHGLKMMVNPMERWQTEGQAAQNALAEAKKLDPENPRITIMEAEDLYFTPEQFGGSKAKGIELFKKALEQFKTYKLKSSLDPNWGQGEANYFIAQAK